MKIDSWSVLYKDILLKNITGTTCENVFKQGHNEQILGFVNVEIMHVILCFWVTFFYPIEHIIENIYFYSLY